MHPQWIDADAGAGSAADAQSSAILAALAAMTP
jgi:hypothetical protein